MKTDMLGLQRWIQTHPRRRIDGYFTLNGHEFSHNEAVKVVNYAVEKGYKTEEDIPDEGIIKLLGWK